MGEPLTSKRGTQYELSAEARGPHWIAWLTRAGSGTAAPERSVVLVGETREEAERRARRWFADLDARGEL